MDYNIFVNRIGARYSIILGELLPDINGPLVVSETYGPWTIYVNKLNRTVNLIVPEKSYVGRSYRIRKTDCVTLVAEWLEDHTGKNFLNKYTSVSNRVFMEYYKTGMQHWFEDNDFLKVEGEMQVGDCILYAYKPNVISHIGVYIGDNKMLHHLPYKFSSIDKIDPTKILGVYRYAE